MKSYIPLFYIFVLTFTLSCKDKQQRPPLTQAQLKKIEEQSIEVNKAIVAHKQDSIKWYIAKNNLSMQKTGTGLWYSIIRSQYTDSITEGDIIEIEYTISLLHGTVCYTSDSLGTKILRVGQGGVESGLEEAFLLMHKGDSAHVIIPPHLAHGLIGDLNRIPQLAILDCKIYIKNHKKSNNSF